MGKLAKMYGKWPHEVLALDVYDLSIALACMMHMEAAEAQRIERATRTPGAMIFPVIVIGGG